MDHDLGDELFDFRRVVVQREEVAMAVEGGVNEPGAIPADFLGKGLAADVIP